MAIMGFLRFFKAKISYITPGRWVSKIKLNFNVYFLITKETGRKTKNLRFSYFFYPVNTVRVSKKVSTRNTLSLSENHILYCKFT